MLSEPEDFNEKLQQGDQQSRKWSVPMHKQDIWKMTPDVTHLMPVTTLWSLYLEVPFMILKTELQK